MKRLFAIVLCFHLLLVAPAGASDWRRVAPRDWVVAVTVNDVRDATQRTGALLDDLRVDWSRLMDGVRSLADGARLPSNSQKVTLGVAAPENDLAAGYPFAVLWGDYERLVNSLQAERTGDVAILTFGGTEFAALRAGKLTLVVPLAQQERARRLLAERGDAPPPNDATPPEGDVTIQASQLGLMLFAERAAQRRDEQGPRAVVLRSLPWPPSTRWIDAAIGANVPLAERVCEMLSELSIDVKLRDDRGVSVTIAGRLKTSGITETSAPGEAVTLPLGERAPIATLRGDATDGTLHSLMRLMLAYSRGRPDDVELPQYPREQYEAVAQKVMAAVDYVEQGDAMLLERLKDDPLMSNRVALVGVSDVAAFTAALDDAVKLWNAMIVQSDANTPLVIEIDEAQVLGDGAPLARRYAIDVAEAIESPPSPEVTAIMERYFGPGGRHVTLVAPLDDHRVLIGDVTPDQLRELAARLNAGAANADAPTDSATWTGVWHVDRYAAWQERIRADMLRGAIGFRPAKPLPSAPVSYGAEQSGGRLTLRLDAPRSTVVALGKLLPGRE